MSVTSMTMCAVAASLGALILATGGCAQDERLNIYVPEVEPQPPPQEPERSSASIIRTLDTLELASGQERTTCFSWTLNNEQPLYAQGVRFANGGAFHHSNWVVVPDTLYTGSDGYWDCDTRGFEEVAAALSGTVLFAQSTQARSDEQVFTDGVVIRIPANSKVVASVHTLNLAPSLRTTEGTLALDLLHPFHVTEILSPITLAYQDLQIPAQSQATFLTECELTGGADVPPLTVHYLLPHFHATTTRFVATASLQDDETVVLDRAGVDGQSLGEVFDPPFEMTKLSFGCQYTNWYDEPLEWGIGINEMCVLFGLVSEGPVIVGGVPKGSTSSLTEPLANGGTTTTADCRLAWSPRSIAYRAPTYAELVAPLYIPPDAIVIEQDTPLAEACVDTDATVPAILSATLENVQQQVFTPWCTFSSCHAAGAGGLRLTGSQLLDALLEHQVTAATDLPLVALGDPQGSYLYQLLSQCEPSDDAGSRVAHMPLGAPDLLDDELVALVREWIETL